MRTLSKYHTIQEQGRYGIILYNLIEKSLGEKNPSYHFLSLRPTYPLTSERGEGAKPYKNLKILSS